MSRLIKVFSIALVLVLLLGLFPPIPVKAWSSTVVYIYFGEEGSVKQLSLKKGNPKPDGLPPQVTWDQNASKLTIKDYEPADNVHFTLEIWKTCTVEFIGDNKLQSLDSKITPLKTFNAWEKEVQDIVIKGSPGAKLEIKNTKSEKLIDLIERVNVKIQDLNLEMNSTGPADTHQGAIYIYGGYLEFCGNTNVLSHRGIIHSVRNIDGLAKQGITFNTTGKIKFIAESTYNPATNTSGPPILQNEYYGVLAAAGEASEAGDYGMFFSFKNKGRVEFVDLNGKAGFTANIVNPGRPGPDVQFENGLIFYQPEADGSRTELEYHDYDKCYDDVHGTILLGYVGGMFKKGPKGESLWKAGRNNSEHLAGHVVIEEGTPTIEEVTVSFNGNGHTEGTAPADMTGKPGEPFSLPAAGDLKKDGHEFLGWNTNYKETTAFTAADFNVFPDKDTPLYAIWKEIKHTVNFNANAGGDPSVSDMPASSESVKHGNKLTQPSPDPTRDFHIFKFWSETSAADPQDINAAYDFSMPVTEDLDLYAIWEEVKHTVTFDANADEDPSVSDMPGAATVPHNAKLGRPSDPTRKDHSFKYWSETKAGEAYDFDSLVTEDFTLFAIWEKKPEPSTSESTTTSVSSETTKPSTVIIAPQYNLWTPKPSDPQAGGAVPPAKVVSKVDNAKLAPVTKAIPVTGESKLYSVLGVILLGVAAVVIFKKKA